MAARATGTADSAVIHRRRNRKPRRGMAHIARSGGRYMRRRGAACQHTVMTGLALRRQHFENTTNMAGFTIDQVMIACEWKTGNEMVKGGRVSNGCSKRGARNHREQRCRKQTQQSQHTDHSARNVLLHPHYVLTPYFHMRSQIHCPSAIFADIGYPDGSFRIKPQFAPKQTEST